MIQVYKISNGYIVQRQSGGYYYTPIETIVIEDKMVVEDEAKAIGAAVLKLLAAENVK